MENRKKVMFLVPSMRGGGSERVISNILKNLNSTQFELELVLIAKEGKYLEVIPEHVDIIDLKAKKVRNAIFKIIKHISKSKPDVLISTLSHLNLVIGCLIPLLPKRIKFIARESNTVSVSLKEEKYFSIYKFLYKNVLNNFNLIVCQSDYMSKDLIDNFSINKNKIRIIKNPVDHDDIDSKLKENQNLIDGTFYNLIGVGRLNHVKGFDKLLITFKMLPANFHLTLFGEGEEKENLQELAKKLKIQERVMFVNFQSNIYKYMKDSDLLVSTSKYEGLPNVILESGACGTPAIAFNCPGGTREIIIDSFNGFLVENGSELDLKNKILLASKMNWDSSKIISHNKKKYGAEKILKEYEKIII